MFFLSTVWAYKLFTMLGRIIDTNVLTDRDINNNIKLSRHDKENRIKNGNNKWSKACDDCYAASTTTNSQDLDKSLCNAAKSGHRDCLRLLIKGGADVNHNGKCPHTPLTAAAENGHTACVKVLVKAGADVNALDFLRSETALGAAAYNGHDACVKLLIKSGADVNKQVRSPQCPPVMLAAQKGHSKCVDVLIKAGADVNAKGRISTPLIEATRYGHLKCVDLLLEAGADVNVLQGTTALMQAAAGHEVECLRSLIAAGADVNKGNKAGSTALIFAGENNIKAVRVLLATGAEVNKVNFEGHNALTYHMDRHRCISPDDEICKLLLAAGETADDATTQILREIKDIDYFFDNEKKLDLMHLCRETIRQRLLQISPLNLFVRVSKLGLPPCLSKYLVHDLSPHCDY